MSTLVDSATANSSLQVTLVDSAVKFLRILEICKSRVVRIDELVGVLVTEIVSAIIRLGF